MCIIIALQESYSLTTKLCLSSHFTVRVPLFFFGRQGVFAERDVAGKDKKWLAEWTCQRLWSELKCYSYLIQSTTMTKNALIHSRLAKGVSSAGVWDPGQGEDQHSPQHRLDPRQPAVSAVCDQRRGMESTPPRGPAPPDFHPCLKGWLRSHVHATQGGLRTPYVLANPPCVHLKGPDVQLPKIVTFYWGDAAARAVIGPLSKTQRGTIKVHDCVEASVWSLRRVNVGTESTL